MATLWDRIWGKVSEWVRKPGSLDPAQAEGWVPKQIAVEAMFADFVRTFRSGRLISELMPKTAQSPLNADYWFPEDGIFAELKTLEKNPIESEDFVERLTKAYERCGYPAADVLRHTLRGEPAPLEVRQRIFELFRRPIVESVKKANKQVLASKKWFGQAESKGLLLVANSNNYGLSPWAIHKILSDAGARLEHNCLDAIVLFSANVYHNLPGSRVAWGLWVPVYRGIHNDVMQPFVDDLGRAWERYYSEVTGDQPVERRELVDTDESAQFLAAMRPIGDLARQEPANG